MNATASPDNATPDHARPDHATPYRWARRIAITNEAWTLAALIVLVIYFTAAAPGKFLTVSDLSYIAKNASPLMVMAVGMTFVIITAGIDLSVGFVLILSGVVADRYYLHNGGANASWGTVAVGALIALGIGAAWGAMQGFLVAKGKIPSLIVTLGGLGAAEGLSYIVTGGSDLRNAPNHLVNTIGFGSVLGVQWLIVIAFVTAIVLGLVLHLTRFGRYTYAIGSNPEAARRAGINVDRHLIKVYALGGLTSGLAGVMSLGYFDTTTISGHPTDNLQVITAVVLGGVSLFGGQGSMFGTVIGIFIPAMLQTGLYIIGVQQYWQYVVVGAVLVGAVYLDRFRRQLRNRA
jgi:ribose transport system permease protein